MLALAHSDTLGGAVRSRLACVTNRQPLERGADSSPSARSGTLPATVKRPKPEEGDSDEAAENHAEIHEAHDVYSPILGSAP